MTNVMELAQTSNCRYKYIHHHKASIYSLVIDR